MSTPASGAAGARRFDGRVAVVTGASRGIGLGIAQRLVAEGAKVAITGRNQDTLDAAVAELGGPGHAIAVAGKADDPEHQQAALKAVIAAFGGLDVLVNNVGINPVGGPLGSIPMTAAAKIFAVNVLAAISWTESARLLGLGSKPGAAVVNLASIAGLQPSPPIGMYGASKAALIHVTAELAVELAPAIRVNAVAPAVVKTDFAGPLYKGREDTVSAGYPLKRLGMPPDIAGPVAFLASDDAGWITGQTLVIDGGLTLVGSLA